MVLNGEPPASLIGEMRVYRLGTMRESRFDECASLIVPETVLHSLQQSPPLQKSFHSIPSRSKRHEREISLDHVRQRSRGTIDARMPDLEVRIGSTSVRIRLYGSCGKPTVGYAISVSLRCILLRCVTKLTNGIYDSERLVLSCFLGELCVAVTVTARKFVVLSSLHAEEQVRDRGMRRAQRIVEQDFEERTPKAPLLPSNW